MWFLAKTMGGDKFICENVKSKMNQLVEEGKDCGAPKEEFINTPVTLLNVLEVQHLHMNTPVGIQRRTMLTGADFSNKSIPEMVAILSHLYIPDQEIVESLMKEREEAIMREIQERSGLTIPRVVPPTNLKRPH